VPNPQNVIPHQFKPGQSGNPGGRPKGRRAVDDLLDLIQEKGADRAVAVKWLEAILAGDFRYMKEYLERKDGKVPDRIQADVSNKTQTLRDFLDGNDEPGPEGEASEDR
jgi:hypothetical protein